ncbi:cell division protein ZapA [Mesonia sp. MT50]|uniref:Cell division protein ZapA n=1 Tax=Mesonia profundi TaxID=3070998 RepID=A0ABU1A435_9FLAO|nr:cell division protein ZapA [Mesonia profundi]MDQ7918467.1 cell division protein ZapA [Mesonia profundi]
MSNDKLKIKLSIADRVYPLTIAPSQEEGLRKAAKKIEEVIKQYEQSYAVRDKQDVLAMCALQFASKTEQHSINNDKEVIDARRKLSDLVAVLDDHLT